MFGLLRKLHSTGLVPSLAVVEAGEGGQFAFSPTALFGCSQRLIAFLPMPSACREPMDSPPMDAANVSALTGA